MTDKRTHTSDCDWHVDQYPWECTCGFIPRKKAMDNLIAQDADLIDNPLVAAVRELLTDDSMEHLDTFTHNLVQAFNKHGLKVVSTDYLDNLNDTVRGLRLDICETQARVIEADREAVRAEQAAELAKFKALAETLAGALEQIEEGTYPRPLGKPWRMDASSSKHDRCIHDAWMYEACEACIDAFASEALREYKEARDV